MDAWFLENREDFARCRTETEYSRKRGKREESPEKLENKVFWDHSSPGFSVVAVQSATGCRRRGTQASEDFACHAKEFECAL